MASNFPRPVSITALNLRDARAELKSLQDDFDALEKEVPRLHDLLAMLEAKIDIAVEALEFYSRQELWHSQSVIRRISVQDGGNKARTALARIKQIG